MQKESSNIWFYEKTDTSFIFTDPSECWLKTKLKTLQNQTKTKQEKQNNKKSHRFQAYSNLKAKSFKILKSKCEAITQKLYSYCMDFILQKLVLYTGKKFCLSFWPNLKGCIVHNNMCVLRGGGGGRGRTENMFLLFPWVKEHLEFFFCAVFCWGFFSYLSYHMESYDLSWLLLKCNYNVLQSTCGNFILVLLEIEHWVFLLSRITVDLIMFRKVTQKWDTQF